LVEARTLEHSAGAGGQRRNRDRGHSRRLWQLGIEHVHMAPRVGFPTRSFRELPPSQDEETSQQGDDASRDRSAKPRAHGNLPWCMRRWPEEKTAPRRATDDLRWSGHFTCNRQPRVPQRRSRHSPVEQGKTIIVHHAQCVRSRGPVSGSSKAPRVCQSRSIIDRWTVKRSGDLENAASTPLELNQDRHANPRFRISGIGAIA
jgi:hypothetical protein